MLSAPDHAYRRMAAEACRRCLASSDTRASQETLSDIALFDAPHP
jgi:hypothetical protein